MNFETLVTNFIEGQNERVMQQLMGAGHCIKYARKRVFTDLYSLV